MDPFECARKGDVDFFSRVAVDVLISSRDENGDSLLWESINYNKFECCRVIVERCPQLLYQLNHITRCSPLHYAVFMGYTEMVKMLIAGAEKRLFRIVDRYGDTPLRKALRNNEFKMVKMLIDADPDYVFPADEFGETPFLSSLRASYGKPAGDMKVKIRRLLLEKQQNQIKIPIGDKKLTILHEATSKRDMDAILDIIRFCPDCMELLDDNGQTFLHIAAKNGYDEIMDYALKTAQTIGRILNKQDNEGNTPLRLAAQTGNNSMALSLLYDHRVNKMTRNDQERQALDEVTNNFDKEKARENEKMGFYIPPEHLELYASLVKRFGNIVQTNLPKFKVGTIGQALSYFLTVVADMLNTAPQSISEENLSEWEGMATYFTDVGLQIHWFRKCISWFRDCLYNSGKILHQLESDFIVRQEAVELKRKELAFLEAEVEESRIKRETARTGCSKFDFTIFDK